MMIKLPCSPDVWIDPNDVSSVRVVQLDDSRHAPVVHTRQGYSIALDSTEDQAGASAIAKAIAITVDNALLQSPA